MSLPIMPVISLEVDQMKHTLVIAMRQYTNQLNEILRASIEAYCTQDNLRRVIEEETRRTLEAVLREEVKNWFLHGEGREVIKKAIEQKLRDNVY